MNNVITILTALSPFLITHVLPIAFTAAFGFVLKWLATAQSRYTSQSNHTLAATILNKIEALATLVVSDIEQVERPLITTVATNGKITPDDAAKLKAAAIAKLKSYLSEDGIKEILTVLGLDSSALDNLLGSFIEKAVGNSSSSTPSAQSGNGSGQNAPKAVTPTTPAAT